MFAHFIIFWITDWIENFLAPPHSEGYWFNNVGQRKENCKRNATETKGSKIIKKFKKNKKYNQGQRKENRKRNTAKNKRIGEANEWFREKGKKRY